MNCFRRRYLIKKTYLKEKKTKLEMIISREGHRLLEDLIQVQFDKEEPSILRRRHLAQVKISQISQSLKSFRLSTDLSRLETWLRKDIIS